VLDQLLSEAGIDRRVTRKYFRSAVEQGCGICVPFYNGLVQHMWEPEQQNFWVLDDKDPNLDEQELVINWSMKLGPDGGPYDIQELVLDALRWNKRGNHDGRYYVHADHGNMLSFGLLSFESCSD
jgi:hypothetical protein